MLRIFSIMLLGLLGSAHARDERILVSPAVPAQYAPPQDTIGVPLTYRFIWQSTVPGGTAYRLQIATDSLFSSMFIDTTLPNATAPTIGRFNYKTTYYWHVNCTCGPCSLPNTSAYSPIWHFTTVQSSSITPAFSLQHLTLKTGDVVRFTLPQKFPVKIVVYDSKGAVVKTLLNETREQGSYSIPLPQEFLNGTYLLDFKAGKFHKVMRLQGK